MIPALRFLLISILLFASVSASAQSESMVFVTEIDAKYHRSTQIGDQISKSTTAQAPSPEGEGWGEVEAAAPQPRQVPGVLEKHPQEVANAGSMRGRITV